MSTKRRALPAQRNGLSMIELIMFIVVVSVALVALLRVLNVTVQHSGDPIINKQMQAIAEAYLDEVSSMPYTYCDPEDANVLTATSTAGCASWPEVSPFGPLTVTSGAETRGGTPPFNNVGDYNGYGGASGVTASDPSGTYTYSGYAVKISVVNDAAPDLGPAALSVPAAAMLHITVTVSSGTNTLTLEGYRTRYAPNAVQ